MEELEKDYLQISDEWGDKAFPIDWNKLPDDVISKISSDLMYNVLSYGSQGLGVKTIIYFRKVKKFRKDVEKIEKDKVIFGV